jgi:hypothetical protein
MIPVGAWREQTTVRTALLDWAVKYLGFLADFLPFFGSKTAKKGRKSAHMFTDK